MSMRIIPPYCAVCWHGLDGDDCPACQVWRRKNETRLAKWWRRRFLMWSFGWSTKTVDADFREAYYLARYLKRADR